MFRSFIGNYSQSVLFLDKAFKSAKTANNVYFQATILNNLSFSYKYDSNYLLAKSPINEAFVVLDKATTGWQVHFLDSKTQILIALNKFKEPLPFAEPSVTFFCESENFQQETIFEIASN